MHICLVKRKKKLINSVYFLFCCKVRENGIAESAGLRVGDNITHVDDIDVVHWGHENIFSNFTSLMIRIYREDELNMGKTCDVRQFPCSINNTSNNSDAIDDNKIAEIISAEAELLEDNVLG